MQHIPGIQLCMAEIMWKKSLIERKSPTQKILFTNQIDIATYECIKEGFGTTLWFSK